MIEETIVGLLRDDPTVAALVGQRIHPVVLPVGSALPAVVYQPVSNVRTMTHDGRAHASPRIQLSCWAGSYDEARQVAAAVVDRLVGFAGTVGAFRIGSIMPAGEWDDYEPTTQRTRRVIDVRVSHGEETPS